MVLLLGLFVPLGGGCSSGPSTLAIEDVPSALGDAICTQLLECAQARASGGISQLMLSESFVERCPQLIGLDLGNLDYLIDATASGRIDYDAAAGRRCMDDIAASCGVEVSPEFFPSCREALAGTVTAGDACTFDEECAAGTRCDATLMGSVCTGTCVALLPVGSPCNSASECAPPEGTGLARCSSNGGPDDVCIAFELLTGVGEGEPCGSVDETGLQRSYALCAASFFCDDPDDDGEGACTRPLADDEPCEPGQACAPGSLCIEDSSANRFCRHITVRTLVGDPCDDETVFCDYPARLVCVSGQCAALPAGTCEEMYHCEVDEYCDEVTELCAARKPVGAVCDGSDECQSDRCRDDGTMTNTRRCEEQPPRCG
ncbi:MAG: hypothetical protein R3B40_04110 [Polyangiales bacterium]